MKSGAPDHHKMRDLAEALGVPTAHAVGLMECFWRWVATYAKDGNVGEIAPKRIAEGAKWEQDPEVFIAALIRARFLDKQRSKKLLVHHWWDHAEDAVHMALARQRKLFADGQIPKLIRFSVAERNEILADYESVHTKAHKSTRRVQTPRGESSLPSPPLPSPALALPSHGGGEPPPESSAGSPWDKPSRPPPKLAAKPAVNPEANQLLRSWVCVSDAAKWAAHENATPERVRFLCDTATAAMEQGRMDAAAARAFIIAGIRDGRDADPSPAVMSTEAQLDAVLARRSA
jgi:hypothetical protein